MNILNKVNYPKDLKKLSIEEMNSLASENHKLVITLEDVIIDGGFGQKVASFYGNSNIKVLNFGAKKEFTDRVSLSELYEKYHLTKELIVKDVIDNIK